MESVSDSKIFVELDDYDARLETVEQLLSITTDDLLNFNHINPFSNGPEEKQNAIAFCQNFGKLDTLILLSQQELHKTRNAIQKLMGEMHSDKGGSANDN